MSVCVCRVVRGLLQGKKVVLVTHQLQFAQLADNILAIKDVSSPSRIHTAVLMRIVFCYLI